MTNSPLPSLAQGSSLLSVELSMKTIPLTKGQHAIVDDEDFDELNKYKWRALKRSCSKGFYAIRNLYHPKKSITLYMHRVIMRPRGKKIVDHINHDPLDNRRTNLRICTHSQNHANSKKCWGTSKYKGVYWSTRYKKWEALIVLNQKKKYLGRFDSEEDAAEAYNKAAKSLFKEFCYLNTFFY